MAARYGMAAVVPILLAAGAKVDARDEVRDSDHTDNYALIYSQ